MRRVEKSRDKSREEKSREEMRRVEKRDAWGNQDSIRMLTIVVSLS